MNYEHHIIGLIDQIINGSCTEQTHYHCFIYIDRTDKKTKFSWSLDEYRYSLVTNLDDIHLSSKKTLFFFVCSLDIYKRMILYRLYQ